jgi:thiamine biosynthesis lipoprotein
VPIRIIPVEDARRISSECSSRARGTVVVVPLRRHRQEQWSSREPFLGTVASLRCAAGSRRARTAAEEAFFEELGRLERQFTLFDEHSELSRWRRDEIDTPSEHLVSLLRHGELWLARSGGVLNPAVGVIAARWAAAVAEQRVPDRSELTELASTISQSRYHVDTDGSLQRRGSCAELTFHSFAKGFLVDLAADATVHAGATSVVANVGGDLVHRGDGDVVVDVEDPLRAYDNADRVASLRLANQAMATSGGSRRGVMIAGHWFSHVLDPRTGWPAEAVASASVVAESCVRADAIATVLSVLPPDEGLTFAAREGVAALIIDPSGLQFANRKWTEIAADHPSARS